MQICDVDCANSATIMALKLAPLGTRARAVKLDLNSRNTEKGVSPREAPLDTVRNVLDRRPSVSQNGACISLFEWGSQSQTSVIGIAALVFFNPKNMRHRT